MLLGSKVVIDSEEQFPCVILTRRRQDEVLDQRRTIGKRIELQDAVGYRIDAIGWNLVARKLVSKVRTGTCRIGACRSGIKNPYQVSSRVHSLGEIAASFQRGRNVHNVVIGRALLYLFPVHEEEGPVMTIIEAR